MSNQRKLGALLSYIAQFIQIAINLIYTPIMLRLVGQSEYGLYQMVHSVVSYLSLLSFGFNTAYIRYYSRYKVASDTQGIASLNGMFITIFTCIAAVAALAGSMLVVNIEPVLGNNLSVAEMGTARILMILMVINLTLTFPSSVFDCYVTSQERFVFQKLLLILQQALNPVITLPLLLLGYGSVALVSVSTVLTVAKLLINVYYCLAKLHMQISFRGFRFSLLREMGVFTFFIFLNQIIDQINWSVDKFLLGRYIGTASVAVYGLAGTINNMYMHLSTAISGVFAPKINALVVKDNDNWQLTELFTKVGRVQFLILALALVGFVSVGKPFMCLWGGTEYTESYYIALFLIMPITIPLIQNLGIEIQRAKNMHRVRSVVYFFVAVGNVLISIPLIQWLGATGAAMGTAMSLFFGNGLFMNWYYHKRIGLNVVYFWKEILSMVPSLLPSFAVGILIMRFADISGWVELAVCAIAITIVYCGSVYLWGMNAYEKSLIRTIFLKLKKRK